MVNSVDKNANFNNGTNINNCEVYVSSKRNENSHKKHNLERMKRPF